MSRTVHHQRIVGLFVSALSVPLFAVSFGPTSPAATAATVGKVCTTAGAKSGSLVCSKKAGKLVWAKPASGAAAASGSTSGSSSAKALDGTWKPTSASQVGYRVKEVLNGQSAEGVGRTNALTGSMVIAGSTIQSVELIADVTTLASDSDKRDAQVQSRILDTAKFPTATIKLAKPIKLGSVPADKVEISQKASITMTVHGVVKDVVIDLKARRNGTNIEINGSIPLLFADWNIADPSFKPFVVTQDNGLLEFLVVFTK